MRFDYDLLPDDKQVDVNRIRRARGERRGRRQLTRDLPEIDDDGEMGADVRPDSTRTRWED